jgi:predicted porin
VLRRHKTFQLAILLLVVLAPVTRLAPARAEDSASQCCAVLDARAAELASAVLGTYVNDIKVQTYGHVNRAILIWNDGINSRISFVDNNTSSSRLGFLGEGTIRPGLTLGARFEMEFVWPSSSEIFDPRNVTHYGSLTDVAVRQAYGFINDDHLGIVSVGHQWSASGDLTLINLGSQMNDAALHYNNAFSLGLKLAGGMFTDLKWGQLAENVDVLRGEYLRYDTPSLFGFVASASIGATDAWDVALRYHADGEAFRFVGGIGYRSDKENLLSEFRAAASLLHHDSGLYVTVSGAQRDDDLSSIIAQPPSYFGYIQAGISKMWLPYGNTTIYGDFGLYRNFNVGEILSADLMTNKLEVWGTLAQTEVLRRGFGIEQAFDKIGLLVYAQAHDYDAKISGYPCNSGYLPKVCGVDLNQLTTLPILPWDGVVAGARLRF